MTSPRRKIFVLDTSVLLYDASAIYNFEEHDVAVPITVLEELDQFKKGDHIVNLQAREFIRELDRISESDPLSGWVPLDGESHGSFRVLAEERASQDARSLFGSAKNDHRILNATLALAEREAGREVVLVTKDVNLRVKARAFSLRAEDYETVRIDDVEHLYSGIAEIELEEPEPVRRLFQEGGLSPEEAGVAAPVANQYFLLRAPHASALAWFDPAARRLAPVQKGSAYGIKPRNAEQTFALHAILNPAVPLVSLSGKAGTGKTLLALAGALEQRRQFRQVYLARPLVPLSNRDIGFLPGDIKSKISPHMQPLWDNLNVIRHQFDDKAGEAKRIDEMIESEKLHITPLAYIRGRSFSNIIFIVDEAQNLTPHEVRTIITRAGEGTKMIFAGDVFQIDTPYLDARSNGLSFLIDRMRGQPLYAHVNLQKGERSALANLASRLL
ncbi:MAG TPA: PhoH family protein [Thermoanaerobaculia bacterium]|nr:PhoH family protein [Thermoanaerobaculia bacterium]